MAKEIIDGAGSGKKLAKLKSRNPHIEFDVLQLYFRRPYVIDLPNTEGSITMRQPSIGELVDIGEKRFYATLNSFVCNTTSYRVQLWDQGMDWNELSDFQLFIMLLGLAEKEVYQLFLPDIDFSNFGVYQKQLSDEEEPQTVLYDQANNIEINEQVYFHISQYLQTIFNIHPEEKLTDSSVMKRWFIDKDKREAKNREKKKVDTEESNLLPIISGCVNHPGFKYKTSELLDVGVFEFYDSVKRLQVYESTSALNHGAYSGFCDMKGVPQENFNFMRPI